MASLKRLGFFLGDDKITLVEFEGNAAVKIISSSLSKAGTSTPFVSNLAEEIQITATLKEILQANRITDGSFYVSLPLKEIILRSFFIPFVKPEDVQNIIRFEAKKYIPFNINDLSYVYHAIPFTEGQNKRLQVFFFAVRKEMLAWYDRVCGQINVKVSYSEPYIVSLTKALLFRKEIKPTDRLAFLILDKNIGRICFIDSGIPQFTREFSIKPSSAPPAEGTGDSLEALNLKIVNEVWDSFDFYRRQFSGEKIGQMLVASETFGNELLDALEGELKLKILKYSPVINTGMVGQSNDMDAIYAMGACVEPPMESLSKFNFVGSGEVAKPGFEQGLIGVLKLYKKTVFAFLMCVALLMGVYFYFQAQLKFFGEQHGQLLTKEGALNVDQDSMQTELQQNITKLNQYKSIRIKSDMASIILKISSYVPQGTFLSNFSIKYNQDDLNNGHVNIDISGLIVNKDPDGQMAVVNQMFADFRNDKELARFINSAKLVSLNHKLYNDKQVTEFNIHFS